MNRHPIHWILVNRAPMPVDDVREWAEWMETADRHVAFDDFGTCRVSTVFLGLDHSFGGEHPVLWETVCFDGLLDGHEIRSRTWEEAEDAHMAMCEEVVEATPGAVMPAHPRDRSRTEGAPREEDSDSLSPQR